MSAKISGSSLRLRLLSGTLAIVAAIWVALSLSAWREALHETGELFDAHLAQAALLLAGIVGDEPEGIDAHLPSAHRYTRKVAFQVWSHDGRLLAHSLNTPLQRLAPVDEGFFDSSIDGRGWRVYSLSDTSHRHLVQVAEAQDARSAVGRELATHLLAPLLIALPLLAAALIVLIRSSLAPLARLAGSIGLRSPGRLDAIPFDGVPRELHPVIVRLNELFDRLACSLEQERRFTADAAHELRTPLAAIRAHAQVAQQSSGTGGEERERALACVIEATDRATHLVEQLLTLTRLDAASLADRFGVCDLRRIAAETLAQAAPAALAGAIDVALSEGTPLEVQGDATLLGILLRNLIDNAVRYSQPGGQVEVLLAATPEGGVRLEVVDRGPGIPVGERPRMLERFSRMGGTQASGSGLGLSIVARIAALHRARFELDDGPAGKGLCARIVFPAAQCFADAPRWRFAR